MFGLTDRDVKEMLSEIGLEKLDDLFKDIPEKYKWDSKLWKTLPEWEAEYVIKTFAQNVKTFPPSHVFLGGGVYFHYVPPEVDTLASRGEFLTAYTPYQPEISQGALQAMWEYQSLMCDLLQMDVCNASHYDGATATAEAMLMAVRLKGVNRIAVSTALNPFWKMVVNTYAWGRGISIYWLPYDQETGRTRLDTLPEDIAGVIVQQPNFFGVLEDLEEVRRATHEREALLIVSNSEPLAWALIKPPGYYDADIAVGSAQSFGIYPSYGGPSLGYMATKRKYMRQMPGRIIGETTDLEGRRAYCMILQTREQHIRRERATSNICTNQALMAIRVAIYLSLYGKKGLRELALHNWRKARKTAESIIEAINHYNGEKVASYRFSSPFFNEFSLRIKGIDSIKMSTMLKDAPVLVGLPLGAFFKELNDSILITVTEVNNEDAIELLSYILKDFVRKFKFRRALR